jgi:hypothetical protein
MKRFPRYFRHGLGCLIVCVGFIASAVAAAESETSITTLTPEQLESYRFQVPDSKVTVKDLTMGQRAIMAKQRRAAKDLIVRQLGIVNIQGTKQDLRALQQLVDREVLDKSQVEEWQTIGVLFGDILAKEFKLNWVSYEDELGENKALRYRKSENYVFPVTLFSKRVRFDEEIDMLEVYAKLEGQIKEFIAWENKPKLPNT